jgi:hypothetical protein
LLNLCLFALSFVFFLNLTKCTKGKKKKGKENLVSGKNWPFKEKKEEKLLTYHPSKPSQPVLPPAVSSVFQLSFSLGKKCCFE